MSDDFNEDRLHYDLCQTTDLTIEIDEPTVTLDESFEQVLSNESLPKVGPPKNLDEALALAKIGEDVLIIHLPENMRKDLCSHLNLNPYGTSLRNWETVAAKMGITSDDILGIRSSNNPTADLLFQKKYDKVNILLEAIAKAGRIDTLVSMRKYATQRITTIPKIISNNGPAYSNASTAACSSKYDDFNSVILLIHLETNKAQRYEFKKLRVNLEAQLANQGPQILVEDLAKIDISENFYSILSCVFQKASHIVVCLNNPYCSLVKSEPILGNDYEKSLQIVHSMMDTEYGNNGSRNKRFRPLLMEKMDHVDLPNGWIQATTLYRWETDFQKLVDRLRFNPNITQTM